jgi:ech hydrogenase subunit A
VLSGEQLITLLIFLPAVVALGGLVLKGAAAQRVVFVPAMVALMVAAAALALQVLPREALTFTPPVGWENVVAVLKYALIAYFLYVGITARNGLVLGLAGFLAVLLPVVQFGVLGGHVAVEPVFYADVLAVIMCLVISVVGGLIVVYATDYMPAHEAHFKLAEPVRTRQPQFFFWFVLFLGAMNGLVLANSLPWLFFFWEVTTLCCYQLIRHDLTDEARGNALRALWMNLIGSVAMVVGIGLAYNSAGTLSIQDLISGGSAPLVLLPLALFCLTGFTKAAQVPFQSWLLGAMVAPTPVSALLHSSTMVKAGVYLVLRLAPGYADTSLSLLVALFGAFVFMVTSLLAIGQSISKRVLAYSTIASLGLIVCCAGINTELALAAGIALIIFHAVSKGMLFMAVGVVEQQIGSRDIEDMDGLVARMPLLTVAAVIGMLSMLFLPFGVAFAKWAAIGAAGALAGGYIAVVAFLAIGSAAALVFWSKWLGRMLGEVPVVADEKKPVSAYGSVLLLVVGAVGLSIFVAPLVAALIQPALSTMGYSQAFDVSGWHLRTAIGVFPPWALFLAVTAAVLLPALFARGYRGDLDPVYLCGVNVNGGSVQFTGMAGKPVLVTAGGAYWKQWFGESRLTPASNWIAVLLLVALFAGVVLR